MKSTLLTIAMLSSLAAVPALATDAGNANAEQQTQTTPNRGNTAGGPAHGPDHPKSAADDAARGHSSKPHGHGDGSKH
ncbi:hypothetical protein [Methylobacterium sp. sgz302541]|uniref:hypothetical protein n=1 Tax=unclassified Methylobacterium TaxID=2615210 RepID=UPI003D34525F